MGPQGPTASLVEPPRWGSLRSRLSGIRDRAKASPIRAPRRTGPKISEPDSVLSRDDVDFLRDIGAL